LRVGDGSAHRVQNSAESLHQMYRSMPKTQKHVDIFAANTPPSVSDDELRLLGGMPSRCDSVGLHAVTLR